MIVQFVAPHPNQYAAESLEFAEAITTLHRWETNQVKKMLPNPSRRRPPAFKAKIETEAETEADSQSLGPLAGPLADILSVKVENVTLKGQVSTSSGKEFI